MTYAFVEEVEVDELDSPDTSDSGMGLLAQGLWLKLVYIAEETNLRKLVFYTYSNVLLSYNLSKISDFSKSL